MAIVSENQSCGSCPAKTLSFFISVSTALVFALFTQKAFCDDLTGVQYLKEAARLYQQGLYFKSAFLMAEHLKQHLSLSIDWIDTLYKEIQSTDNIARVLTRSQAFLRDNFKQYQKICNDFDPETARKMISRKLEEKKVEFNEMLGTLFRRLPLLEDDVARLTTKSLGARSPSLDHSESSDRMTPESPSSPPGSRPSTPVDTSPGARRADPDTD